jgi:hypothetical protein
MRSKDELKRFTATGLRKNVLVIEVKTNDKYATRDQDVK